MTFHWLACSQPTLITAYDVRNRLPLELVVSIELVENDHEHKGRKSSITGSRSKHHAQHAAGSIVSASLAGSSGSGGNGVADFASLPDDSPIEVHVINSQCVYYSGRIEWARGAKPRGVSRMGAVAMALTGASPVASIAAATRARMQGGAGAASSSSSYGAAGASHGAGAGYGSDGDDRASDGSSVCDAPPSFRIQVINDYGSELKLAIVTADDDDDEDDENGGSGGGGDTQMSSTSRNGSDSGSLTIATITCRRSSDPELTLCKLLLNGTRSSYTAVADATAARSRAEAAIAQSEAYRKEAEAAIESRDGIEAAFLTKVRACSETVVMPCQVPSQLHGHPMRFDPLDAVHACRPRCS